jgi:hypothetical protein
MITGALLFSAAVVATAVVFVRTARIRARRESHIRTCMFPRGLLDKLAQRHPNLDLKQRQLVARGLRQFFLAYLKGDCQRVAMPSQVVDDLWHEFILFTRDYSNFCQLAFGQFLHHTPAVAMRHSRQDNEGLRRVWWHACREENINPRKPTRLPLLFALDHKLGIADGFHYALDCAPARRKPEAGQDRNPGGCGGGHCATDFTDSGIDGTTDGLGDGGSTDGASADGGSGCGGGCGGD